MEEVKVTGAHNPGQGYLKDTEHSSGPPDENHGHDMQSASLVEDIVGDVTKNAGEQVVIDLTQSSDDEGDQEETVDSFLSSNLQKRIRTELGDQDEATSRKIPRNILTKSPPLAGFTPPPSLIIEKVPPSVARPSIFPTPSPSDSRPPSTAPPTPSDQLNPSDSPAHSETQSTTAEEFKSTKEVPNVEPDLKLTRFPIKYFKRGKKKLGKGAFGTVRV